MNIERLNDSKQARVRLGIAWLTHLFTVAPVASVVYSVKTGNWVPTLAATGVAVVGVPLAALDLGFTLAVAPPVTSAVLLTTATTSKRNKLGIIDPLQADSIYFEEIQNNTPSTNVTGNVTA